LGPIDDDLFHWQASIIDPSDTSYSGSIFYLDIHLPSVIIQTNKGIHGRDDHLSALEEVKLSTGIFKEG
ncbi:13756_t:CDS:2, partial [Rhizophagus irregularis]